MHILAGRNKVEAEAKLNGAHLRFLQVNEASTIPSQLAIGCCITTRLRRNLRTSDQPIVNLEIWDLGKIDHIASEQCRFVRQADRGEFEIHSSDANPPFLKPFEDPCRILVERQDRELHQSFQALQELSIGTRLRDSRLLAIDKREPSFKCFLCGNHCDENLGLLRFNSLLQAATSS